ncbi:TetR/AcrR family transcriptional regulator [Kaustia mangrovi]|uniref:TetR/AcrR family transcriptional regulator n=1 Tax=Kaustia mangrovi TaxID=2593653 RepID=A0A7S8HAF8_9HYPH|nr:TetR/AcrR family transcriptional regulator [Kaustia mangrovi]QPC41532.1 TetR/AcrR family transcriptional regulator [Kaustia mangrovi]
MVGVRQFDEEAVLAAALETFWRQGFAATSMPDLARATGVQRGSLYNAFGDRETLFLRAFDLYETRFLEAAEASLQGDDAEGMLDRFFDTAIATMTHGSPARGCLTTKTATDGSLASDRVGERVRGLLTALADIVEAALTRPGMSRQLVLDPGETAQVVVTFTRGLAVMERVHGDPAALRRNAAALTRALVVRPVRAPSGG